MKKLILLILLFSLSNLCYTQDLSKKGSKICSMKKSKITHPQNYYRHSPNTPVHTFDVLNYKLNLDIYNCYFSPYPKSFSASNIITFIADTTLNYITLNSNTYSLAIDTVKMAGGIYLNYDYTGDILRIDMNMTYNLGDTVTIEIDYRHLNVTDNSFYVSSSGYVFTDAEPEGARGWFPCWDRPSDKATLDLTVKVPSNVRLGSNGRLNDSTLIGDSLYYHWVSRDPISTYLMVMTSKVDYTIDIVYWHKTSNPNDSIPLRLYSPAGVSSASIRDILPGMTTYYSNAYSEMPFEKNGFCYVPGSAGFVWGGMENQTLTTIYGWYEGLIAHEYAHQWWGDMVTCASWSNIWLNEGFATWSEAYWDERTGGYSTYKASIDYDAYYYLSGNPGWAISNPNWDLVTPSSDTLFNFEVTYCKGACVLHLLRYTLGDSLFFLSLKEYGTDTENFRLKNATIEDFFTKFESVSGVDLEWFKKAWIYQPNHPIYENYYGIQDIGGGLWQTTIQINQVQTNADFFPIPIELRFSFLSGADTTIKVMNDINGQIFSYTFDKQPTTVMFDPDNEIVLKSSSIVLGLNEHNPLTPGKFQLYQNYPNPFNPETKINYDVPKNSHVKLVVYDVLGKEIKTLVNENKTSGKYTVSFNGISLPSGVYFYRIQAGNYVAVKKMVLIK